MPSKREGTKRVTFFIPDETYESMQNYISTNYSASDSYGARSAVASMAISNFCANPSQEVEFDSMPVNYSMEDKGQKTPDYKNTIGPLHDKWLKDKEEKKNV